MLDPVLTRGFVATQIAETMANYALVDDPLKKPGPRPAQTRERVGEVLDDGHFWKPILRGEKANGRWDIYEAAVSEWVARVPGLFWTPAATAMRKLIPALVERKSGKWVTYRPLGKSQHVVGGIGTLRLPPADDGYRLITLTTTLNASAGIPALVAPSVWEHRRLSEGTVISATAQWREMAQKWAIQFPVVRGIPRGYFVLERPEDVRCRDEEAPIHVHPFSVMEYSSGSAQMLDYVYATGDTSERSFRGELTSFFERYRKAEGRDGTYLLSSDISEPMWDAWFSDPTELRRGKKAQLQLIEDRVNEAVNGGSVIDALANAISTLPNITKTDLLRLSEDALIKTGRWSHEGTIAENSARLVAEAVRVGQQKALLQLVIMETSLGREELTWSGTTKLCGVYARFSANLYPIVTDSQRVVADVGLDRRRIRIRPKGHQQLVPHSRVCQRVPGEGERHNHNCTRGVSRQ